MESSSLKEYGDRNIMELWRWISMGITEMNKYKDYEYE